MPWTPKQYFERVREINRLATETGLHQAAAITPEQGPSHAVSTAIKRWAESNKNYTQIIKEMEELKLRILRESGY